ncbi:MAG: aspartate--tRNA ligase [Planctomycetes bacterium]|nr:aspartate--tRNA ligase [Planctomycetota bacterium]
MMKQRSPWQRTHTCGELTIEHRNQAVVLNGWIENHRHHGQLVFLDLRDRYGVTQIVVDQDQAGMAAGTFDVVRRLGAEDVIAVTGTVRPRDADKVNKNRSTGEIELVATSVTVLGEAETPPFEILDKAEANEELRMQYRYLDLRRRPLQEAMIKRARFVTAIRQFLHHNRFLDIETPILTKSTPEGARDYLVPSRVHPGKFFALPQSPQIFKQLCMVAGLDRYYQIARCFRDEDLRADRQPEFTQIDLEMSFVEEHDVLDVVEAMFVHGMKEGFGIDVPQPFPRFDFQEAMEKYGCDKPDLRFGMTLVDCTALATKSDFKVFSGAVAAGGIVKGICAEGAAEKFSRKGIDELTAFVNQLGAKGLAWAKVTAAGLEGSIAKFYEGDKGKELIAHLGGKPGDLLLFVADQKRVVHKALGDLRLKVGGMLGLRDPKVFRCCWVLNFPMFEWNDEKARWQFAHNPFSAPVNWDIQDFGVDTESIRSRAYDFVMNGWELGSGSIRIHKPALQAKVFEFLGIPAELQRANFGFLLDAYRYGGPPHGGIALGVDRIVTLALGREGIRDVIAFPKTATAYDLMADAPGGVSAEQMAELQILSTAKKPG